jgi:hypothetical protein
MERGWRCGSIPTEFFGLDDVIDRIEAASGKQPVGWLGDGLAQTWNTLDYLAEAGIRYVCGWVNDDQPYLFDIGNPPLVSLPYSVQTNDVPAYFRDEGVGPRIRGDAAPPIRHALREGETVPHVMAIAVHPFVTGQPHRIGALDAASNTSARMPAFGAPPAGKSCSISRRSSRSGVSSALRRAIPGRPSAGSFNAGLTGSTHAI